MEKSRNRELKHSADPVPEGVPVNQLEVSRANAIDIGRFLSGHNGQDVKVMDLSALSAWTDFFVICTVTSAAHLNGLMMFVKQRTAELGLEAARKYWSDDGEWNIVDLGDIVIHLMSRDKREFYELEKLWYQAETVYGIGSDQGGA
jgi:ribosome-associated protein